MPRKRKEPVSVKLVRTWPRLTKRDRLLFDCVLAQLEEEAIASAASGRQLAKLTGGLQQAKGIESYWTNVAAGMKLARSRLKQRLRALAVLCESGYEYPEPKARP